MSTESSLEELRSYSITAADTFSPTDAMLAVTNDTRLTENPDDDHSFLVRLRRWKDVRLIESGWPIRSLARSSEDPQIIAVSARGRVRCSHAVRGGADEASIHDALPALKKSRTMLNEICNVGGQFYALGTRRALYRRLAPGQWESLDRGCYDASAFDAEFTGLVGLDQSLCVVGTQGEIWRYERRWVKEKSGTTRDLRAVCLDTNGAAWAVGDQGTCLRRTGKRWAQGADDVEGYDYTSVVEFNGSIYATANWSVVLKLNAKRRFVPVDFGRCRIPSTAAQLKVRDGLLYCYGPKDLVRFDGTAWKKLLALSS